MRSTGAMRGLVPLLAGSLIAGGLVLTMHPAAAQQSDRMSKAYSGLDGGRARQASAPPAARTAAEKIARAYGVRLVGVRVVDVDGKRVYEAAVMNPGGDYNEAFQVTRLLIDPATGDLLPGFRHLAAGYRLPGASPGQTEGLAVGSGPAARRMSGRH